MLQGFLGLESCLLYPIQPKPSTDRIKDSKNNVSVEICSCFHQNGKKSVTKNTVLREQIEEQQNTAPPLEISLFFSP